MQRRTLALFCIFLLFLNTRAADPEVPTRQKLTSGAATDSSLTEYKWVSNLAENGRGETELAQTAADENFSRENNGKEITSTLQNHLDRSVFSPTGLKDLAGTEGHTQPSDINAVESREIFSSRQYSNVESTETQIMNPLKICQEERTNLSSSETPPNRETDKAFDKPTDPNAECLTNNQSRISVNEMGASHLQESSAAIPITFEPQAFSTLNEISHFASTFNETAVLKPVTSNYEASNLESIELAATSSNLSLEDGGLENSLQEKVLFIVTPEASASNFEKFPSKTAGNGTNAIGPESLQESENISFHLGNQKEVLVYEQKTPVYNNDSIQSIKMLSSHAFMPTKSNETEYHGSTEEHFTAAPLTVGMLMADDGNQTSIPLQDLLVQNFDPTNDGKRSKLWQNAEYKETLNFDPTPDGERYEMETLGIADGVFVFTYLGDFLSFIQPYDFPVEFVRDAVWKKLSVVTVIMQSLQVEAGFVTCLVVGVVLSLVVPLTAAAATCSDICRPPITHVSDSVSMSGSNSINCNRRYLVVSLFFIVIFIGAGVTSMVVTNEQLSSAILQTPRVLTVGLNDAANFVRNTQQQVMHITLNGLDRTLDALYTDLDDVETLLGEPIQREVAGETGVDVALDALVDMASVADELSKKVVEMQETIVAMRDMSIEARDRLLDLRSQVDSLRRACPSRDRPLCDTIDSSGLEIVYRTDGLNSDSRLNILRSISVDKLPELAQRMSNRFSGVPADIARGTEQVRASIKKELSRQKTNVDEKIWPLENLVRDVRSKINGAREYVVFLEEGASGVEQWRWFSILIICFLVIIIWCLLVSALVYGCCDGEHTARCLLIASLTVTSLFSIILWAVALICFVVGGHGEVFICRPLYDQPAYKSVTELLDDPGVLYQRGGGFIRNLLPRNRSLNVPVRKVLEQCEKDKAAYEAFQLKNVLDLEEASDFREWGTIFTLLKDLNKNYTQLQFLDPELQEKLQNLLQATAVNMTIHRAQISKPITGKDLISFAKQLDSVANQIKDLSTASRIETLASRTRRLIATNIQPLEAKKEELLYLVTALDVQITPLQRQVNQSISHLKTIQFYIDNQGANISNTKTLEYTTRLIGYLDQYRGYLLESLGHNIGPCQPIWNVFNGLRQQMCRQVMDPLNGFWFALVWCLLWLIVATPVCIKLIHYFELYKDGLLASSNSSVTSTERGAAAWNTPGAEEVNNSNW